MKYLSLITYACTWLLQTQGASSLSTSQLEKRTARTSPPSGCFVVRGSGIEPGDYSTLSAAVTALGSSTADACIFIYNSTYTEALRIDYGGALTLYGYTTNYGEQKYNTVTITRNESSAEAAGKQYYSNCYIEGAIDFIFGAAAAWFGECTIASNGGGAITANSRSSTTDTTWYVIDSSTITAASGYSISEKVYLGRPWRQYARVIFQTSNLTNIINAAGWTTLYTGATPIFEEYDNTGDGSSTSYRVEETRATAAVTKTQLWGDTWADWIDTTW
uniref:Pectinesterase n=1 Tax=Talaromyces marneffei PM1 TaxID=1077442 RepID=A0A093VIU4_TALMA